MKSASLVYFYFGDSYLTTLGQETVPVGLALEGYDRSVLLHFDTKAGPFEVSKADEKNASVIDTPTIDHMISQLDDLRKSGYTVDLFMFTHGSEDLFRTTKGVYGENAWVSSGYFESKVAPLDLRAVWQCNCYGATWNETWSKLGAKVSAGTQFVNFYPNRFGGFMRRWTDGATFADALAESDTAAIRTAAQTFILGDALSRLKEWNGTVFSAPTILGKNKASERYFTQCWLESDYDPKLSGKGNMNRASEMIVEGNRALTR